MSDAMVQDVMVKIDGLVRHFDGVHAVDNVSFSVARGQVLGFIGPNGAGKTTTMRILATLDTPQGGDARIGGYSVVDDPEQVRRMTGFMPDYAGVYTNTTVEEYLERCALKTAKLFEAACLLGSRRTELGEFGLALGIAFQIVDDCLDCAGQTVETGKIAGTDLREGIPTLPLLLAAREDEVVRRALAGGSLDGALLRVAASGAIEEAREVARGYAERARACLDGVEAREELDAIADAVVERTA